MSSEYITVTDADSLDQSTGDFAFECRFYHDASNPGSSRYIVSKGDANTATGFCVWIDTSGYVNAQIHSTTYTIAGAVDKADGSEHHLAVNFDRDGNMVVYVDGASYATKAISAISTTSVTNAVPLEFGVLNTGAARSGYFTGRLREIRYYVGRVMTTTEITYNYNNPDLVYDPSYMVCWLKCDEGSGTALKDSSGNGNHGTLSSSSWVEI